MRRAIKRIYRSWLVELIIVAVILIVLFIFYRADDITTNTTFALSSAVEWILTSWDNAVTYFDSAIRANLIKLTAVFAGGGLILYILFLRLRWRIRKSERLTSSECPKCNYPLSRVKRTEFQKTMSAIIPLRRLFCKKCRWKGVRVKPLDTTYSITSSAQTTQSKTQPIRSVD